MDKVGEVFPLFRVECPWCHVRDDELIPEDFTERKLVRGKSEFCAKVKCSKCGKDYIAPKPE